MPMATDDLLRRIEAVMYTNRHTVSMWTYSMHTHAINVATLAHKSVVAINFNLTSGVQQTIIKQSRKQILVVMKP